MIDVSIKNDLFAKCKTMDCNVSSILNFDIKSTFGNSVCNLFRDPKNELVSIIVQQGIGPDIRYLTML
jgi:hypothetical protein